MCRVVCRFLCKNVVNGTVTRGWAHSRRPVVLIPTWKLGRGESQTLHWLEQDELLPLTAFYKSNLTNTFFVVSQSQGDFLEGMELDFESKKVCPRRLEPAEAGKGFFSPCIRRKLNGSSSRRFVTASLEQALGDIPWQSILSWPYKAQAAQSPLKGRYWIIKFCPISL